jgi:hypothetical protein
MYFFEELNIIPQLPLTALTLMLILFVENIEIFPQKNLYQRNNNNNNNNSEKIISLKIFCFGIFNKIQFFTWNLQNK